MRSRVDARMSWLVVMAVVGVLLLETSQAKPPKAPPNAAAATASAVKPKALSENTQRALTYLVAQQHSGGGWGQGGGWRQNSQAGGRVEGAEVSDPPDLGNTCIATLALIRAGNTPQEGPYAKNVARAATFICYQVEQSNPDELYVTDVRDTQLQSKIGQYVDTFLAGLVLSELKGKMPPGGGEQRLLAALDKTVRKIEKNQKADGTFAGNTGWASVLSQGLCSKFMNRAVQNKVAVKDEVLQRDFDQSVAFLDKKTGKFASAAARMPAESSVAAAGVRPGKSAALGGAAGGPAAAPSAPSDAGVNLYYSASNASRINDFGITNEALERSAKDILARKSATTAEKQKATSDLSRIANVKSAQESAVRGIVEQLGDKQFIAGFGNNGGEEFLSYMNISEMLVAKGGPEWQRWDKSVAENLDRVQNQDGSWSGQHCITGRTFCTSAALLTLMADRAPMQPVAKIEGTK